MQNIIHYLCFGQSFGTQKVIVFIGNVMESLSLIFFIIKVYAYQNSSTIFDHPLQHILAKGLTKHLHYSLKSCGYMGYHEVMKKDRIYQFYLVFGSCCHALIINVLRWKMKTYEQLNVIPLLTQKIMKISCDKPTILEQIHCIQLEK